uniref:Elastin microfibril interfacer 3a n=1 Tax=Cyprinus carpio TaxID=7962 RepID=A0A8C1TLS8_CYPCA
MLLEINFPCFLLFWSYFLTVAAFQPAPNRYSLYTGSHPHKLNPPMYNLSLFRNQCAYVVEKTVSFTVQDGAAPFMKAEYNKCAWGQKCPTIKYRMYYKPMYKVAYKTLTELEWKCCPGYAGVGCTAAYEMKARPLFKEPPSPQKGPMPRFKGPMPMQKGPIIEDERLDRIEEDVQRLFLSLDNLRGTVTGLEDSLRASLYEDANRMLTALISAGPSPLPARSQSRDSSVGFGDLPGGALDINGSDLVGQFSNLVDLAEKVSELQADLMAKVSELDELRGVVAGQNNTLQRLSNGSMNLTQTDFQKALETMVESKMSEARVAILDGFEKRVKSAEEQCEGHMAEVRLQCKEELLDGQGQIKQVLDIRTIGLTTELHKLQAQLQDLEPEEGCCMAVSGLTERLIHVEQSVGGLNESQIHLLAELGGHKDHIEGMLEGRLGYVESKMSIALNQEEASINKRVPSNLEAHLEEKLKALERGLLAGQDVPTLETDVESLRRRVEDDLDLLQKQLKSIEVMCTSSCVPQPVLTGYVAPLGTEEEGSEDSHKEMTGKLDLQVERLNNLSATLHNLLVQFAEKQDGVGLQGEVTLLKISVNSVNRSLCGLQESLGSVIREVGQTNLTWQEREERLAQQVKGVVQLVGRQASMLGTGERKLTRLKGELQDLRSRVAGELQGCRSTALGVQKEVTEVGGRVARVEGQCGGLAHLADDLERIRGELERHSDGYLSHVNITLVKHSHQLSELRDSIPNCTGPSGSSRLAGDNSAATQQTAE